MNFAIPGLMDVPQVVAQSNILQYLHDAEVGVYNATPVFKNDTWDGIPELSIKINGAPPASPLVSAVIVFFKANYEPGTTPTTGCLLHATVVSGVDWRLSVLPSVLPLERGDWVFHIKTTDGDGIVKTRVIGTLPVL